MPVRGGLALTGNAPNRPASTLPAPAPRKSRSTSAGLSGSDGNERVVAAVCTITTMAIRKREGNETRPPLQSDVRQRRHRQRSRDHADHADALALEAGADRRDGGGDKADQRAGNFGADGFRSGYHGQHAESDTDRVEVGFAKMLRKLDMR